MKNKYLVDEECFVGKSVNAKMKNKYLVDEDGKL